MTNYVTKLIGFLLIPAALFVIHSPIQAEAGEKFEFKNSLVAPVDITSSDFDFEKGQIKFTVNGNAFKSTVKFNKLTGELLDSATTMFLILDCRVSRRVDGGLPIVHEFPVMVEVPLDTAIKGEKLKHKEKGSLLELPALLSTPLAADIEDGDVFEVLSVRIELDGVTVAVPGFKADLNDDGKGKGKDDDDKGKDKDDDDKDKGKDDDD